jgi:monofunctional glycosyltransferase
VKTLRKIFSVLLKSIAALFVLSLLLVVLFRFVPVPVTPLMVIRCVEQWQDDKPMKLRKDWVSMEKISPHLQLAVVCSEDQNFLNHNGFDFKAIEKAMEHNEKSKRKRGASTISQQTAKNLFLWPGRSWLRKGLETYFTLLIELMWPKERILEVYLNIIEFGNGVYGAQAASQDFFKRDAAKLSKEQAALLSVVLPNPRKYSATKPGPYLQNRQQWVLRQMRQWGSLDFEKKEEK